MFKSVFSIMAIFLIAGCTSLVRKPHYVFQPIQNSSKSKVSLGGEFQPIGFDFKGSEKGRNHSVWISVLNRGGTKGYAVGLILPIIPVFFFSDPPEKMDFSKRIEVRIHSYSAGHSKVSQMPESPEIVVGNKKYLPIQIMPLAHDVQIYTYNLTPADAPEFILLETTTRLEDGSKLETPQIRFSFRDRVEWIYHRGP